MVKENKKYRCIPSFPLKKIRRYLINNELNYNFQIFNYFCCFVLKCMRLFLRNGPPAITENNGPLKVLLTQSQSAISPEVMLAI